MTLVSAIIRDAYRESNLIDISRDPTTDESAEGLRLLNRYVLSLFGNEAGDGLTSVPIGRNNIDRPSGFPGYTNQPDSAWVVPVDTRLVLNLTSAQTVYLHPKPRDGSRFSVIDASANLATYNVTLDGNGNTVAGSNTSTLSTNSLAQDYFFRADKANWAVVSPLIATDESPFPQEFDDLLILGLAFRLNPRNGVATDMMSMEAFKAISRKFRARYSQSIEMPVEEGLLRTLGVAKERGPSDFSSGMP